MSIDLVVVRCCTALVALAMICNVAAAQSGNRLSKVENTDETKPQAGQQTRVPQSAPAIDQSTMMDVHYPQSSGGCCCDECESSCGPECAQGCHECVPSRKSKIARLKDWLYDRRKPVVGFCVEEVQYGANAGTPSYDYNSHGVWWTGVAFGPGHGKLAALKSCMAQRRAIRKANRQSSCGCRGYHSQGCDSGCCATSDLSYSQYGDEAVNSYPLFEEAYSTVAPWTPTPKE